MKKNGIVLTAFLVIAVAGLASLGCSGHHHGKHDHSAVKAADKHSANHEHAKKKEEAKKEEKVKLEQTKKSTDSN